CWGFDLGAELGFSVLWDHFNDRCDPPWTEKELRHKCRDADKPPFNKPRGWLRDEPPPGRNGCHAGGSRREGNAAEGGQQNRPPQAWEQPIPLLARRAVPPFPVQLLPPWLQRWVKAIAEATQTPADLAGLLGLCIAGAGLARKFRVQVRPG